MRSKLFVPGSQPELFTKALASQADAITVDLEDSVLDNRKAEARKYIGSFLKSPAVLASSKRIIVRCNSVASIHFEADLLASTHTSLDILNLPKVESADDIYFAAKLLKKAEVNNNVEKPVGILANIESPKGLRFASEIATAHPRVVGLQLGLNDFFGSLAMDRRDSANIHAVMFALRMAAGEAGVFAYDGAFADIRDTTGFLTEARLARRLGYLGKSCIHPSQVAFANKVFTPSDEETSFALRVLQASRQAESRGVGVFTLEGIMIDLPAIRHAEMVITASQCARDGKQMGAK